MCLSLPGPSGGVDDQPRPSIGRRSIPPFLHGSCCPSSPDSSSKQPALPDIRCFPAWKQGETGRNSSFFGAAGETVGNCRFLCVSRPSLLSLFFVWQASDVHAFVISGCRRPGQSVGGRQPPPSASGSHPLHPPSQPSTRDMGPLALLVCLGAACCCDRRLHCMRHARPSASARARRRRRRRPRWQCDRARARPLLLRCGCPPQLQLVPAGGRRRPPQLGAAALSPVAAPQRPVGDVSRPRLRPRTREEGEWRGRPGSGLRGAACPPALLRRLLPLLQTCAATAVAPAPTTAPTTAAAAHHPPSSAALAARAARTLDSSSGVAGRRPVRCSLASCHASMASAWRGWWAMGVPGGEAHAQRRAQRSGRQAGPPA